MKSLHNLPEMVRMTVDLDRAAWRQLSWWACEHERSIEEEIVALVSAASAPPADQPLPAF